MKQFAPVRSRRVSRDVLEQILDRIRSGELRVGDMLPGERVLAEQMDVSRPTVSAAIARLTEAGLLRSGQGRNGNPQVVSIWIPESLDQSDEDVVGDLNADEIFRILEARKAVEPRVAQLAALRADDALFDEMAESIELLKSHRDDISRAVQAEQLFHRIMWRGAQNPSLERMMKDLQAELVAVKDMMMRTTADFEAAVRLHDSTLQALMRGDPDEIEYEMLIHLGHFESIVEDALRRSPRRKLPNFLLPPERVSSATGD